MADRKAVNRYYPPDFDPGKHGSINKFRNSHPLRERAKRLSEGILVIRFEMPYNIWCGGCGKHIGMGVRYNAEKTKVGNYYSTPIYRFRMKCHLCDNYFEMETNPMICDYTIVTGAYRKNQKWDMAENEQVLTEDRQTVKKLAADPMFKLEHGVDDTKKLEAVAPTLHELEQTQSTWKDDFDQNRMLRGKFRMEKSEMKSAVAKDRALLDKSSLDIELVPEHEDDKKLASLMKYSTTGTYDEKQKKKRLEISNRGIFSPKLPQPSSSLTSASSSTKGSSVVPTLLQPSKDKEPKVLEIQKRLGLLDKVKATKRGRAGFDDFDSFGPSSKTPSHDRPVGIVMPKRKKEARTGEGVDDSSRPELMRKTSSTDVDDGGSSVKSPAFRGISNMSNLKEVTADDPLRSVKDYSGSQDLHGKSETGGLEEVMTPQPGHTGDAINPVDTIKDSPPVEKQDQCDGSLMAHLKRTNPVKNSDEIGASRPREAGDSKVCTPPKSLVACDYSSSDSDE